ncbi:MAG TPA: YidB family protein [Acetobacteraceae bacterium]|nr:YidB family protein [Acetobacteraceae bacterium]
MQLIHRVIEGLREHHDYDDELTPLGAVLVELLGGERGSLPELANRFSEAGLSHIMASWVGPGPALPISTRDLRHVLGEARVEELATMTGLPSGEFLVRLARLLPAAVRRMHRESSKEAPAEIGGSQTAGEH